ncbi:hypothetical protein [Streptomyces sp. NPDC012508]|uniref:hypothetical protein n=1 Tax=Streptomyces sp. NPDC012508 TaxID=3364837 RepID=UPI0036B9CA6E
MQYGEDKAEGLVIAAITFAVVAAPSAVGLILAHRSLDKRTARLRAAGLTPVTDANGRLRFMPPGRLLPGHGNPFAPLPDGSQPPDPTA